MLKPPKLAISSAKYFSSPSGADATTFIYDKNLIKKLFNTHFACQNINVQLD